MLLTKNISMSSITGSKNATMLYRVGTAHMREGELARFCSRQHSALKNVVKKSTYRGFPLPKAPKTSGGAHFLRGRKPFWWKNHQMLLSLLAPLSIFAASTSPGAWHLSAIRLVQ